MRLVVLVAALWFAAAPLGAQRVQVNGAEGTAAGELARRIVARDSFVLIERDTVLPPSFRAPADLVVLNAEVHLEGSVTGDVAVLGGELFLRPRSRVGGQIALLGGELYPSGLAVYGDIFEAPNAPPVRETTAGEERRVEVVEPPPEPLLALPGLFGLALPTYDRVNGVTLAAGANLRLARRDAGPTLGGSISYRTGSERGGGGIRLGVPLFPAVRLSARAAREVFTNDEWIRGDLANSAAALFTGSDVRNYYESDRLTVEIGPASPLAPIQGQWLFGPRAGALLSRDRSLRTTTTFSVLGGDDLHRPNLAVANATLASLNAGSGVAWQGMSSTFAGDADVEWAPGGVGDIAFTQARFYAAFAARTFGTQKLSVQARWRTPLDGSEPPPQRWSLLGGSGTLPTYPLAAFVGDRLVFVDSRYAIPLNGINIPVLGTPQLQLRHATGAAWPSGAPMPTWAQNVGVGLHFFLVGVDLWIDPRAGGLDPSFGLSVGFGN